MEQSDYPSKNEKTENTTANESTSQASGTATGTLPYANYNSGQDNINYFNTQFDFQEAGSNSICEQILKYVTRVVVYITFILAIIAIIIAATALNQEAKVTTILSSKGSISSTAKPDTSKGLPTANVVIGSVKVQTQTGCPNIGFRFPRNNQIIDYVRYVGTVPNMYQATTCTWVETTDYNDALTGIVSYASGSYYNAYLLGLRSPTEMLTFIRDYDYGIPIPDLRNLTKFHLCHWFSSTKRQYGLYVNGKSVATKRYPGYSVRGRGTLILGQEQDSGFNRGFDIRQSLHGNLTNFMIWPRVLNQTEIKNLANNCTCPQDYYLYMSLDQVEKIGKAEYFIPEICPTL